MQSPYGLFGISIAFLFIFGAAIILEIDKNKKELQKENVNAIEENNETQEDASIINNEEQSSVPSDNDKEVNNNEK